MIGCCPDSNTPDPSALWPKAVRSAVRLNAGAGVPAMVTCMIVPQYSAIQGVLEDYLASLQGPGEQGPGEQGGQLAFTGGEIILILGAGAGLIGSGALLRRRRT